MPALLTITSTGPGFRRGGAPGEAAPLHLLGSLLRRWHVVERVGVAQELQAQRRPAFGAAGRPQRRGAVARREPLERHPRLDHRSGGQVVSQEPQHRRHAVLLRASADGAPLRVDRRRRAHHRGWLRRAGHRARDARPAPSSARRRTVAGDKGYDTKGFVADTRALGFTPHVAQNISGTGDQRSTAERPDTPAIR